MIYSVWDQARRRYDYYDAPDAQRDNDTSAPRPAHLRAQALGTSPERAAWPLPSNAQPIGNGKYARGMVASRQGSLSGLGFIPTLSLTPSNLILWGALAFVGWKFVLPKLTRKE